ncbi:MAG TPA: hypothetical protein PK916_12885 [Bacteroidota bacterium]|nr:hypothetical protein [Bacteroidota bacterium]
MTITKHRTLYHGRALFLVLAAAAIVWLGNSPALRAQSDTTRMRNLQLAAHGSPDSITLRWGAIDYVTWKAASAAGYIVERAPFAQRNAGNLDPQWTRLTPQPLRPLSIEQWRQRFAPEDSLAGAAVQSYFGESIGTSTDPFGSLYEMYLQQQNLHGFGMFLADIRPDIADGYGLRFVDRGVSRGQSYLYRVFPATQREDLPMDTAYAVVGAVAGPGLTPITTLKATEDEKLVVLQWEREESAEYGSFVIERSTDGGRSYTRLMDIPYVPLVNPEVDDASTVHQYRVKLERNYEPVRYRVRGGNAFGMLSPPGNEVLAMGRDKTAPAQPAILPHRIVNEHSVEISWDVRDGKEDADLAGFLVAKSEAPDGPYDVISDVLPRSARSYVDARVKDIPPHYYVVSAIDTAGNSRMSAPVFALFPDSIAPMTPTGLVADIDSSGIVTLRWKANTEDDLQGYRVFFANDPTHEFQQLTTVITRDTMYTDTLTLKTLTERIWYRVTALDLNYNHSPFTPALEVEKPDIVPPTAPSIHAVESGTEAVDIAWYRSPTSDATEHVLYRRRAGEQRWTELYRGDDPTRKNHRDATAESGVLYEYAVQARDDDGLLSPLSNVVTARRVPVSQREGVQALSARYDAVKRAVLLQWSFTGPRPSEMYIYKGTGTTPVRLYVTLPDGSMSHEDKDVRAGDTYTYAVRVVYPDGAESVLERSAAVEVR